MFFSSEKELFSWTYLLRKTPRRTKILISPVWNKVLKIWGTFWADKYRRYITAKISSIFVYNKKLDLVETIKEKKRKNHAQNWKICILYIYWEYLLSLQFNASGSFCKNVLCRTRIHSFSLWRQHNTLSQLRLQFRCPGQTLLQLQMSL